MNIAVLSENFLETSHKERLDALGSVAYYEDDETIGKDATIARLRGVEAAVFDPYLQVMDLEVIEQCPDLKYITINAVGYDNIDVQLLTEHGIAVSNTPGINAQAVAEFTFGLIQAVNRGIVRYHNKFVTEKREKEDIAAYIADAGFNLEGKTLGIVGYGDIGQRVARIGEALGMRILIHTRSPQQSERFVDLEMLLAESDVVTLHIPLTTDTEYLMNAERLAWMKPSALLINASRGKHVDNEALAAALKEDKLAGAALDALDGFDENNPLLGVQDKVVITPHIGWLSKQTLLNNAESVTANIEAYASGNPIHVVNNV